MEFFYLLLIVWFLTFWLIYNYRKSDLDFTSLPLLFLLVGNFGFSRAFSLININIAGIPIFITELLIFIAVILFFVRGKVNNFCFYIPQKILIPFCFYLLISSIYFLKGLLTGNLLVLRDDVFVLYPILFFYTTTVFNCEEDFKYLMRILIPALIILILIGISKNIYMLFKGDAFIFIVENVKNFNFVLNLGIAMVFYSVFLLYNNKYKFILVAKFLLLCLGVALIIIAGVRSSWVAFSVSIIFLIILTRNRLFVVKSKKMFFLFLVILFFLVALFIYMNPEAFNNITSRIYGLFDWNSQRGAEVRWRLSIWAQVLKDSLRHPFLGRGFGNPQEYIVWGETLGKVKTVSFESGIIPPHNYLLTVFSKIGAIGLLFLLIFIVNIFKAGLVAFKETASEFKKRVLAGLLASLLYWNVMALFFDVFDSPVTNIYLWVILGALVGLSYLDKAFLKNI